MPRRGRKRRKMSTPHKAPQTLRRGMSAEEMAGEEDLDCYMAVEVEEVAEEEDAYLDVEGEADFYRKEVDDINDDEVHRIDTSWIKEEPMDDETENGELHIHSQEEHNGEVHVMKRKRNDGEEEDHDPNTKYIKTEVDNDYVAVDSQKLIDDNIKTEEEEDGNETDDYWEEDPDDVVQEKQRAPVFLVPLQSALQQKCAKCAIMFTQGSSKLPSALQNLCKKCKPNVSITCKICGKHFEHHKLYKRHIRDCSNNHFECATCKERFPTQRKVLSHKCVEENFLRVLRYICPICSEGFEKAKQRNHHKSLHVNYKTIKCRNCKLFFDDLASFQEHMDIHAVSRTFICSTCHLSFDTQAEFFADERKHKAEEGGQYERERPPEFVYVCKKCKHWYDDLSAFNHHDCIKKKGGLIRVDCRQVNAVPRVLDVVETSDKIVNPLLQIPARKEPPKQTFNIVKRPRILPKQSPKEVAVNPVNNEQQSSAFDSAYTCQLCCVSFKNSRALGFHSCLVQDDAFVGEDDEEEEEESDGADNNGLSQGQEGESPIHIKLTPGLKTLNFSDVMRQAEPNQDHNIPPSSGTKRDQSNSNFKHTCTNRCVLCSKIVRHNFDPVVGKGFVRYLCPQCMKKAAKEKNCVFKCSKCGQTFPSMSRLHMHLPWHRETTGEEGVFKEPRLACKYLPPGEEASTPSPSIHSPANLEGVLPEPDSFRQNNAANGKEQTAVHSQPPVHPQPQDTQPFAVGKQDTTLLSALLKEPINPLGGQNRTASDSTETGHQRVKGLLRQKIADRNVPIRIAPKVSIATSQVGNQLVINAPLITPKNLGNVRIVNQGDSLFAQVDQGMFPPVASDTTKDRGRKAKKPLADSASTGGKQDGPSNKGPRIQEYKGMRVKITNEGPRKTVQVLPSQDAPKPGEPEANPGMPTGTQVFSLDQSATSTSIPVGTIACVTAPLISGNGTVPLTFGGNTLKKTNPDGSSSTLTSFAAGPGTLPIQPIPSRVEAVNTKPLNISSVKQTGSSMAKVSLQNIQPPMQAPVLVSLPVDQSKPSETPRGVFLCYSCNLLFMDIHSLKSHGCQIQAFNCNLCNTLFDTPELLYNHKCLTQMFTCHMCNKKCSSAKELNQHPCIDTNDIRIGQESTEARGSNPVCKGPTNAEKGREDLTILTSQAASQTDNGEMDKSYRTMSWQELSKVKDFTCLACGAKFSSNASLYIHKMKHNMRV